MKIRYVTTLNEFKSLEDKWEKLFLELNLSVFQSFEFNFFSWVQEFKSNTNNKLCIVIIEKDNSICSIFPLYIDTLKRLRFINDNHIDFCDILSNIDIDIFYVLDHIKRNVSFHSFHFKNLKSNSLLYIFLNRKSLKYKHINTSDVYSELTISKGVFPNNDLRYTSKYKSEFRRVKKINKEYKYKIFESISSRLPINELTKLRDYVVSNNLRNSSFLDSNRLLLIEELYKSNKLVLSVVEKDSKIHSCSFILKSNNNYLFWIDLYDNSKLINVYNYISFIELISVNKDVCISFGRGDYSYKTKNFNPKKKKLIEVTIFKNNFSLLLYSFYVYVYKIVRYIYKKIM